MPIECITIEGGTLTRQDPIEPGSANSYHYLEGEIGKVILACCHTEDLGGRIYMLSENDLAYIADENNTYSGEELDKHSYEIIPMGCALPIQVTATHNNEIIFWFNHYSNN